MSHSNPVANRYGIKFKSSAASPLNSLFGNPADLIKVDMARNYFTKAVGNTNERPVYIGIAKTTGVK
jgi:hypothetical protein